MAIEDDANAVLKSAQGFDVKHLFLFLEMRRMIQQLFSYRYLFYAAVEEIIMPIMMLVDIKDACF